MEYLTFVKWNHQNHIILELKEKKNCNVILDFLSKQIQAKRDTPNRGPHQGKVPLVFLQSVQKGSLDSHCQPPNQISS